MGLAYSLDPSRHLVRILLGEPHALEEVEAVLDQLLADPQFKPDFGVLVDHWRLVAEPDETYVRRAIELIAERRERFASTRFGAVSEHLTGYRMGRLMMEPFAEKHGVTYRVFRDEAEALAWLSGGHT